MPESDEKSPLREEDLSLTVWQDVERDGEHFIEGNTAGLKALLEAISTVLDKNGAITVGVKTKDGRVTVELLERAEAASK
jgi:hypothetical protein